MTASGRDRGERRRGVRRLVGRAICLTNVAVLATMGVVGLAAIQAPSAAAATTVQDIDHGTTTADLAQSLAGQGVTISNVTFTGTNNSAGLFTGGASSLGIDTGVVMGTGSVQTTTAHPAPCSKGVEGPNQCNENSTQNFPVGDADLTALSGFQTYDASVLEFDFTPVATSVQFKYVFGSDEYSEYANTQFNDVFAFFVNGTNCALVPNTTDPVSVNTINNGNPGGDQTPHNAQYYRDNPFGASTIDNEMDGLTTVLTCSAAVNPGQTNHMKLAIADASDQALDSNVFIEAGSLVSGTQITTTLHGGGQDGASITVPSNTSVHDSAVLAGTNIATATGSVTYTVYSDASCTQSVGSGGQQTVTGGVVPDSNGVTLAGPGPYYWRAAYSGDGTHNATTSMCGDEVQTISGNPTLSVSKTGSGSGSVSSSPAGIACGATCSAQFNSGTVVTLTESPAAGSTFAGWSGGGCSGTATTCQVTLTSSTTVTATFATSPKPSLSVSKTGSGSGSVSSSPAGIACGATCSAQFNSGTVVTLTESPAAGSTFAGWSGGGCSGTATTCQVTLTSSTTVTAMFAIQPPGLTITASSTPKTMTAGQIGKVRFTVRNPGETRVHGVVVTVTLPSGATPISIKPSAGACSAFTNGKSICMFGDIAAGGSRGIDVLFRTPTGTTGPSLVLADATSTDGGPASGTAGPTLVAPRAGYARGFVPPGGSISIGNDPTAANPLVSTFELPKTGSGAPITLRVESCTGTGHSCAGNRLIYLSPFTGYDDPTHPPELKLVWDVSIVGTSTTFPIYIQKVDNGPITTIPNCKNYGDEDHPDLADPHPCVELRKRRSNGDVEAHILLLSGDPRTWR